MNSRLLEAGKIINTHGIRGEVKIESWCDSPELLASIKRLFIRGSEVRVVSARVHRGFVLAKLDGTDTVEAAMTLKNTVVFAARDDIPLPPNSYFIADAIGLPVFDERLGREIGTLADVLDLPASRVFCVKDGSHEVLIPAVKPFIEDVDTVKGIIRVRTIEGMSSDEN